MLKEGKKFVWIVLIFTGLGLIVGGTLAGFGLIVPGILLRRKC